jgi:hypothetical protein
MLNRHKFARRRPCISCSESVVLIKRTTRKPIDPTQFAVVQSFRFLHDAIGFPKLFKLAVRRFWTQYPRHFKIKCDSINGNRYYPADQRPTRFVSISVVWYGNSSYIENKLPIEKVPKLRFCGLFNYHQKVMRNIYQLSLPLNCKLMPLISFKKHLST